MGKKSFVRMKTDPGASEWISSDLKQLGYAVKNLATHAIKLGSLGIGTTFFEWLATIAAIYLLILDRTNWRTNIFTSLLVPYIFFSLPSLIFNLFRGEVGKWIAFVAVVLRLFFSRRFPEKIEGTLTVAREWLELPAALIVLIVVAPSLFADTIRDDWIGAVIDLVIAIYLLQEHIRAAGGFRNSFTQSRGISNTIGIILLLIYPIWAVVAAIL